MSPRCPAVSFIEILFVILTRPWEDASSYSFCQLFSFSAAQICMIHQESYPDITFQPGQSFLPGATSEHALVPEKLELCELPVFLWDFVTVTQHNK